ncbi:MAG: response regulator, partial [Lachnospiraceae bacterium]|nr:response regulator [Lachnospiraceae bacterium]
ATDKRIVMANPYATDRSHGDTLERCHLGDLFVLDENAEEEFFIKALDDKQTLRLNGKKDDRIYSVSLNAAKDDFGDPYCFICVFMDVSAEANAIKELEIANNAKTEFLTSISHEIRTPINAMLGFNEMIMRDAGDDTIVGYANNADRAGRQLLSIVNGLLDMGQIASGKMSIVPEEYNPAVMLSDVYEMQTVKAGEKELNLSIYADENTPSILIGDALRIRQIITNLVSNAIKYTNEGSVDLIMECGKRDGDNLDLIIKVTDTGIGIKEESIPYLYDTFTRFDKEANKHIEGTGVGLSVTKNLVDMMDGTIDVKSIYGEGTTFTVVLPQKIMDTEPIGKIEDYISRREEVKSESFIAPRASLLVVDDNEMNLSVFSGLVSTIKADVDEALSGAEMLELIKKKKYHIIFLDHMMPEMDGVETLEKMKEDSTHLNTDTPVIVMTANAGVGAKDKYVKMGFDDYLSKPTRSEKLLGLIKSYLADELIDEAEAPETEITTDSEELPEHAFPDVPGIDWKAACMNVPKKEALFDIMGKFCSLADREIAELDDYYMQSMMNGDEDALDLYRIKVHSMKNSAALIGANDLATKAKRLEDAPDKRDFVTINRFHKTFIKEYRTMADNLEAIVLKTSSSDIPIIDDDALKEKLDILEKAMEEFDTMTLNRVMFELSEYSFSSKEVENAAEDLGKAVRDFDTVLFENTMETMRSLIQA